MAPAAEDAPLPLATLAGAGGHWLHRVLEAGRVSLIGVGHGRTLAAVVSSLPRLPRPGVRFVSLLGSLTRHSAANPFDVIHRLTEITGAESYFMPAPFFADSIEDKAVLLGQRSLEAVFALARTAELVVVGIGEVGPHSHLLTSGMITRRGVRRGRARRCRGRAARAASSTRRGRPVAAGINDRALAVRLEDLPGRQVVAIAGGRDKARAIAAVLESGLLTGLITDEATARELAALGAAAPSPPGALRPSTATTGRAGHV